MLAVAFSIFKRFEEGYRGASNLCEVVYSPDQYSFLWDGVSHTVRESERKLYNKVYDVAYRLVALAAIGELPDYRIGECRGGANHYHRYDITPYWSHPENGSMRRVCGRVGSHIFYSSRRSD